jgi:phage terminase large subunit-like protein
MNLWQTDAEGRYMNGCMQKFKELAVSKSEFKKLTNGKICYAGVDLSKCRDLTAVGYVWRLDDGRYAVSAHGFLPRERAKEHEHTDRVPYFHWAQDGWCSLMPGAVTRIHDVEQHIINGPRPQEICYDPYGAYEFANTMTDKGYTTVEIRQGVATLSEPTKKFRDLVLQGKIVHDGSPLLTWCLYNAVEVVDNNGNIKLSKKHQNDSQRIDAIAAIINAMVRAYVPEKTFTPQIRLL